MAFLKDLAKSLIRNTVPEVGRNLVPSADKIFSDFSEQITESKDLLRNMRSDFKATIDNFEGVSPMLKTLSKQARSGKFGMTQEEQDNLSFSSSFGKDWEGMGDFGSDNLSSSSGSEGVAPMGTSKSDSLGLTPGDALVSESINFQTTLTLKSSRQQTSILSSINKNIALIAAFTYEQTQNFYTETLGYQKVSMSFQQQLLEKSEGMWNHFGKLAESRENNNKDAASPWDLLNPSRIIKKARDDSMFDMFFGEGSMLNGKLARFSKDPLGILVGFGISQVIKHSFQKQITAVTNFIETIPHNLQRMFVRWSSNDDKSFLGKMKNLIGTFFKVDIKGKTFKGGKFVDGPVDFDGKTRHAIVSVIPMYLAKILKAVSRSNDYEVYSYEDGNFVSGNSLKKQHRRDMSKIRQNEYGLGSELMDTDLLPSQKKLVQNHLRKISESNRKVEPWMLTEFDHYDRKTQSAIRKALSKDPKKLASIVTAANKMNFEVHSDLIDYQNRKQGSAFDTYSMLKNANAKAGPLVIPKKQWDNMSYVQQAEFKMRNPKAIIHRAKGGPVFGPGGPTEDKIDAKLSNGEFVVNARGAKMFRSTLEGINKLGLGAKNKVTSAYYALRDKIHGKLGQTAEGTQVPITWENLKPLIIYEFKSAVSKYLIDPLTKQFKKASNWIGKTLITPLSNKIKTGLMSTTSKPGQETTLWGAISLSFGENILLPLKKILIGQDAKKGKANSLTLMGAIKFSANKHIIFPLKTFLMGSKKEAGKVTLFEAIKHQASREIIRPLKIMMIGNRKAVEKLTLFQSFRSMFNTKILTPMKRFMFGDKLAKEPLTQLLMNSTSTFFNKLIFGFNKSEKSGLWANMKLTVKNNWRFFRDEIFDYTLKMLKNRFFPITKDFIVATGGLLIDKFKDLKGTLTKISLKFLKEFVGDDNIKRIHNLLIAPLQRTLYGFRDLFTKGFQFALRFPLQAMDKVTDRIKLNRHNSGRKVIEDADELARLQAGKSHWDWRAGNTDKSASREALMARNKAREEALQNKAQKITHGEAKNEDVIALSTERTATFTEKSSVILQNMLDFFKRKEIKAAKTGIENKSKEAIDALNASEATDVKAREGENVKTDNDEKRGWLSRWMNPSADSKEKNPVLKALDRVLSPLKGLLGIFLNPFKMTGLGLKIMKGMFLTAPAWLVGKIGGGVVKGGKGIAEAAEGAAGSSVVGKAKNWIGGIGDKIGNKYNSLTHNKISKADANKYIREGKDRAERGLRRESVYGESAKIAETGEHLLPNTLGKVLGGAGKIGLKLAKGGGIAGLASLGGDIVGNMIGGEAGKQVSGISSYMGMGAMIGSVIPGLGTAMGAGAGALMYLFSNAKAPEMISGWADKFMKTIDEFPDKIGNFLDKIPDAIMNIFGNTEDIKYDSDGNPIETDRPTIIGKMISMFGHIGAAISKVALTLPILIVEALASISTAIIGGVGQAVIRLGSTVGELFIHAKYGIKDWLADNHPTISRYLGIGSRADNDKDEAKELNDHRAPFEEAEKNWKSAIRGVNKKIIQYGKAGTTGVKNGINAGTDMLDYSTDTGQYDKGAGSATDSASSAIAGPAEGNDKQNDVVAFATGFNTADVSSYAGNRGSFKGGAVNFSGNINDYAQAQGKPDVTRVINSAAVNNGIDPKLLNTIAMIESSKNPDAGKGTSYQGLFQFGEDAAKQYGLTNRLDPADNAEAAAKMMVNNAAILKKNNVPVNATTLYLAHQQGPSGAIDIYNVATKGGSFSYDNTYRKMMQNIPTGSGISNPGEFLAYWDARISGGGKPLAKNEIASVLAKVRGGDATATAIAARGSAPMPISSGTVAATSSAGAKFNSAPTGTITPAVALKVSNSADNTAKVIESKASDKSAPIMAKNDGMAIAAMQSSPDTGNDAQLAELRKQTGLLTEIAKSSMGTSIATTNLFNGHVDNTGKAVATNDALQQIIQNQKDSLKTDDTLRPSASAVKIASSGRYS
jgi:hypothetical protein